DVAAALRTALRATMDEKSVLRGQLVSFVVTEFDPSAGGVTFLERPRIAPEDVILPEGVLDRVARQVLGVAEHRDRLLAAGQHLKRRVLLYGPPGPGPTHPVRHPAGAPPRVTVTVLTGTPLAPARM